MSRRIATTSASKFADEARKIHYGETEERGIYGTATDDESSPSFGTRGSSFINSAGSSAGTTDPIAIGVFFGLSFDGESQVVHRQIVARPAIRFAADGTRRPASA